MDSEVKRAVLARNGLMISPMLALCPIRLKNFAALTLGTSLRRLAETWWIVVEPVDAKSGRADERPCQHCLPLSSSVISICTSSILGRGRIGADGGALWISSAQWGPMSQSGVEKTIERNRTDNRHRHRPAHVPHRRSDVFGCEGDRHTRIGVTLLQHRDRQVTESARIIGRPAIRRRSATKKCCGRLE